MDNTKIQWTDSSWTPIRARNKKTGKVGWYCEHATPGCEFCYSEAFNRRMGTGLPFKPGHRDDVDIFLDEQMLTQPLRWKKPRMIFVCSMTDLFGEFVTDAMIDQVFAVMALCPQHTFQCLTKRSDRMRAYFDSPNTYNGIDKAMNDIAPAHWCKREIQDYSEWPLRNVWLGVSCERQREADLRIPDLLNTPAAIRFISAEPLIGPISFRKIANHRQDDGTDNWTDALAGVTTKWDDTCSGGWGGIAPAKVDWVIVGGESGTHARRCEIDWVTSIVGQCQSSNTPVFVKQLGAKPTLHGFTSYTIRDSKGGDIKDFPEHLKVREWPVTSPQSNAQSAML